MRLFVYIILVLLFSVLANNALKAQVATGVNLSCDIQDPLLTIGMPSLFGDQNLCCGLEEYQVCFDLESYFEASLVEPCSSGVRLLSFEYPGSAYSGNELVETTTDLADLLNSILIDANLSDFAVFEASTGINTFLICADTIASNEFLITIKCGNDTIKIDPTTEVVNINPCPVDTGVLEDAYTGIMNGTPPDDIVLFNLDSTATNAGDIIPGITISGDQITTSDLLEDFTWDIPPGSTLNPNALPSAEEVGHLLNAFFGSGQMNSVCSGPNLNCMLQEMLTQFPLDSLLFGEEAAILGEQLSEEQVDSVFIGLQGWINDLEENGATPASYINSIFGWNLPDIPCPGTGESFGGETDVNQRRVSNQATGTSRDDNDVRSSADEDYFSQEIPGIGAGAMSPPTPSALAMMQAVAGGVNLYNGAQSTSIPLHTFQAYDIGVPVSISSSNNGLQVDALPGSAGQHWSINAGGQITRTVKGLPDELLNEVIYSAGVGQQVLFTPRWELPSTVGVKVQLLSGCDEIPVPEAQLVWSGIGWAFDGSLGEIADLGPIKFDIRWSGFQPDKVHFIILLPVFKIPTIGTVYLQVGSHIGFGKSTFLMPMEYEETLLGYAHISNSTVMATLGLPALDENLLEGLADTTATAKVKILKAVHPGRKRDENAVISDLAGTWGAMRATWDALGDGRVTHETTRLDLQPDEFNFTTGSHSGKFFIKPNGEVFLTPYQPAVHITPAFEDGEFVSFEVQTPDGFVYTFGKYGDKTYIDYTQDMTYLLPNFYAYPEIDASRDTFSQAQIDVSILERFPFLNASISQKAYGNTYDRNYKITNGPRYAAAWHLVHIRSLKTQQEVNFEYEEREGLSYFSNKSYSHSFPDFGVGMDGGAPVGTTEYLNQHNPLHLNSTRWENGRGEFTYTATQTTQDRWDLKRIYPPDTLRGEEIIFLYENSKKEIPGDVVCSEIQVIRNDALYRGWELEYDSTSTFDTQPAMACTPAIDSTGGSLPVTVTKETTFSLGTIYQPNFSEYNGYFWFLFDVCKWSLPFRAKFPFIPPSSTISHRKAVSELGSLMEVRARAYDSFEELAEVTDTTNTFLWLAFDADHLLEIFRAEGKRTFLREIKEIAQDTTRHEFVKVEYNRIERVIESDRIPKRFSTDQDQYGYPNKNRYGSPFPAISYTSIFNSEVNSANSGMAVHYGFFNKNATSPDSIYMGKMHPKFDDAYKGSLKTIRLASGASITYDYELNVLDTSGTPGAGLRVVEKIENPGDTPLKTTTYGYGLPVVNTLPRHVSQNKKDIYYRAGNSDIETKVTVSSYPQNMMMPNGSNLTGYEQVTEAWENIGKVVHHFTTPTNFAAHIANTSSISSGFNIAYECLENRRDDILNNGILAENEECPITEASSPSIFVPGILRQIDLLFGLEWKTETFNADNDIVLSNVNNYTLLAAKGLTGEGIKLRLFNSSMYQYNYYGTFLELYARRYISQYASFGLAEAGVPSFIFDLVELIFANTPFSGRYIDNRFETVHYDYPALQVLLDWNEAEETYSGGGTTSSKTFLKYNLGTIGKELLVDKQTVSYSDSIDVETRYHYAFQLGTSHDTLLLLHDTTALIYLNTYDYQQPVIVETYVDSVRTQASITALTRHGSNKIAPRATYGLQNGNLAFIGKFGGYNGDAKPTHYLLAKFGTLESNTSSSAFFDTIHLTWYSHLNLPLQKRKYLEFETTQNYSGFYEYAGNVDHNGVATGYEYDKRGRLDFTSVLNGHQETTYSYTIGPGANNVLMETDYQTGEEMNVRQAIDGFGKEKKLTRENDGATLNTKEYDGFWRVVAERNIGTGIVTKEYEASPLSKLLTTLDEENNVFSYEYKGQTLPSTSEFKTIIVTDPNGHANESHYNSLEQLTRTFNDPEESQVIYSYDQLLRPSEITNPIGEKFTYDYNEMGLLWRTTVPGRGPQSVWYDHKFRPVASSDGNNHHILTEYDGFDRPEKTYLYETGFSLSSGGISDDDHSAYYETDNLLSAVEYVADSKTWVDHTENRLLDGNNPSTPVMVISDNTLDDIGRVIQSVTEYPDEVVKTTLAHSSAGYLLASQREIVLEGDTTIIGDEFEHDNVLRPLTHKVFYGDERWVFANRMAYSSEDHLLTKWVGGMPMEDDRFLQEVNYGYDRIGRLIRINNTGTFFCNIEEEMCSFSLELTFPLLWENCDVISGIKINGEVYPLSSPINLLTQQSLIKAAIEAILNAYGLGGEVRILSEEYPGGQTLTISVSRSSATELSLILGTCEQEVAFTPDCCTIPPAQPIPHIPRSPEDPEVCTADLYHQLMSYNGLDINQITIGSGCGVMMRNNYEYDGLHRITAMNNVLFGPTPFPDAFSNTYSYDKAGNIKQLMRRGIVGMSGSTPESDTIDLLDYAYAGSGGVSSILASVDDGASNPTAQPLGVAAPINTYGYDGNGNMTVGGPVNALYNIMNLPTQLTTSAGERHFAYVYGGGKYSARIEADSALSETRLYLGGMEFKDGEPENYNFGDGRIVYSDTVPPRPQFRLHDHLGNTVVFFEDKDNNGCITTEADTSGLALEILQRLWYYPFGMNMEGLSTWDTEPGQWYRYNGKERDTLSGWTDFGARWHIAEIGRWNGVDPVADKYPSLSTYNYVANNPIAFTDPDGRYILPGSEDKNYKYSKLARYLKNGIGDLLQNENIRSGLRLIGGFSDSQIDSDLAKFGQGITINLKQLDNDDVDHPQGMERNGDAWIAGQINIDETLAQQLQDAKTPQEESAALLGIISTILHESIHDGQNRFGYGKSGEVDGPFSKTSFFDEKRGEIVFEYFFNGNPKSVGSSGESGYAFEDAIWNFGGFLRYQGRAYKQGEQGKIDQAARYFLNVYFNNSDSLPKMK